jgi:Uri superfamily endonuclease
MKSSPGTYALLLALHEPAELDIGKLGRIRFDAPFYIYFGSAFGPGGLAARVGRHMRPVQRFHWHIDYLRRSAPVTGVWYSTDPSRLECSWARAAAGIRGMHPVPGFGSTDCSCESHLLAAQRLPSLRTLRKHVSEAHPGCAIIRAFDPE